MDTSKYSVGYYPAPGTHLKWASKDHIEKAPQWCSVDLRDGNQSLVIPMSLEEKLEFYHMLLRIGFKEIEVGFPAASDTEYEFLRTLIENNMIPQDVTVQVLTQCREHIIRKTFDACKGAPSAIIHFYNSVSVAQREQVFRKSKEEIKKIAIDGAKLVKKLAAEYEGNFRFEYSPESFTGTEPEYALEVCNAVLDVLEPGPDNNVIINLPVTVEMSMPHVYASQVEYMSENLKYREHVTLSLHPHNDRGTGVADTELALLAGADRVEGTLFGNGERTGNVDIVTLAMNMYSHGVDPELAVVRERPKPLLYKPFLEDEIPEVREYDRFRTVTPTRPQPVAQKPEPVVVEESKPAFVEEPVFAETPVPVADTPVIVEEPAPVFEEPVKMEETVVEAPKPAPRRPSRVTIDTTAYAREDWRGILEALKAARDAEAANETQPVPQDDLEMDFADMFDWDRRRK